MAAPTPTQPPLPPSCTLSNVDFVLDIGGQDMKSLHVNNGVIDKINLNEACSSGCGSFISTFANSLGMSITEFAECGVRSKSPVDLGTRCTVFMNSRVKQSQKEGCNVEDISGGIATSIVKNALFKVIRLRTIADLGKRIVVQGGTFYNDAVLRAFERVSECEVVRPDIAGIMGAFGAALIARERYLEGHSCSLVSSKALDELTTCINTSRCGKCANNCLLTITSFSDGGRYVSGNRCERGAGEDGKINQDLPNLVAYKYHRAFHYKPLPMSRAINGKIGIPRALNIFEDYPFWFTLFTELGFQVILSRPSSKELFELGMETIPSESICYPAKLVHGHIADLVKRGLKLIFYPCLPKNRQEDSMADNQYNCPIVGSYPEVIRANMDLENDIHFLQPFLPIEHSERMKNRLFEELKPFVPNLSRSMIQTVVEHAYAELDAYQRDVQHKGEQALSEIRKRGLNGIVLAARPYHIDPEVNHGVCDIILSYGFAVFTEDSLAHLGRAIPRADRHKRVCDQWVYHSRLYGAANFVARQADLDILQLVSFGCGLDSVTTDQVKEIMDRFGKIYTQLKIDEISNLGAARIRIRSLIAVIKERNVKYGRTTVPVNIEVPIQKAVFRQGMKETHVILAPQIAPFHLQFFLAAFESAGFKGEILEELSKEIIDVGLKYVHNDACFPAICAIGQLVNAMHSGKYDPQKTAVVLTQTGGCCRATNYVAFLRKALNDAGFPTIPIISLNAFGMEEHPGFNPGLDIGIRAVMAVLYGDILMQVVHRVRPYEIRKGSVQALYDRWVKKAKATILSGRRSAFKRDMYDIVQEFDEIPIYEDLIKPKVGITGEIMVKLQPDANNKVTEFLEKEGAEVVNSDVADFFLYCVYDEITRYEKLSGTLKRKLGAHFLVGAVEFLRRYLRDAVSKSKRFHPPHTMQELADLTEPYVSLCNQAGEGWFLTGEMISFVERGVNNILCLQPFACLPNHLTGRGMMKMLRRSFPSCNIAAVDYDPGASEINQINRIKLMLAVAFKKLKQRHPQHAFVGASGDPPTQSNSEIEELCADADSICCEDCSAKVKCQVYPARMVKKPYEPLHLATKTPVTIQQRILSLLLQYFMMLFFCFLYDGVWFWYSRPRPRKRYVIALGVAVITLIFYIM